MYFIIFSVLALIILGVFSTVRFNRKKPMTREEYEEYEKSKKN